MASYDSAKNEYEGNVARLLEFGLASNFEYVAKFQVPEIKSGCFLMRDDALARNEELRQQFVAKGKRTEEQIMDNIYATLLKCPRLAAKKYTNFAGQEMFPLWYFVLSGGEMKKVEDVFRMHPNALAEPLAKDTSAADQGRTDVYTLLQAACSRSSHTSDEVLAFLARNSIPEVLLTSFQYEPLPFVSRVIDRPRHDDTILAPLEVIQALAPPNAWNLDWFNDLLSLGYTTDVLHYAIDRILSCNSPFIVGTVDLSPFLASRCTVDVETALEIGRLLCPASPITISTFHCAPAFWTREGLISILLLLQKSSSVENLSIQIGGGMFQTALVELCLTLLEETFAVTTWIETVCLAVENVYLESIVKGLVQGRCNTSSKLDLTIEILQQDMSDTPDLTGLLLQMFNRGFLEKFYLRGPSSRYTVDFFQVCSALCQDTTVMSLEMDLVMTIDDWDDRDPLAALLAVLKSNVTMMQVVLYDKSRGVDYTGFTTCPKEMNSNQKFFRPKVYNQAVADRMLYYMRLNQCGRKLARTMGTSKDDFIALLDAARVKFVRPGVVNGDLKHFNVVYGLLIESGPSLWSPSVED